MIPRETFTSEERTKIQARVPEIRQLLLNNIAFFPVHDNPLLKVGDTYNGFWLEHNQDSFFLADYDPETAWACQEAVMKHQREDGLLPFNFLMTPFPQEGLGVVNYGQVQAVWPFTRCALEVAKKSRRPMEDFQRIYVVGCRYDQWLVTYRNRGNTGLFDMFCEYDTGHDNDPRVKDGGIPHACPGLDACNMPDIPCMPIQSVDLSAMVYGSRVALAELAELLERSSDALVWRTKAKELAQAIDKYLYDPEDQFYYDRDTAGLRKYRTEHITRLFLNHVLTQERFDEIYDRYFTRPGKGFFSPFPIPSMAIDDPHFDVRCPKNSWGANSQALTMLRTLFWMDYYHREEDQTALLSLWMRAFLKYDSKFPQEINPFTGKPIGDGVNYSPALILYLEAARRIL